MNASSQSFDAATPGTSDEAWLRLLIGKPQWLPAAQSLVVVAPHPDDETLGAGGLIASFRRLRPNVIVVSVTDGERAYSDWPGLGAIRHGELLRALRRLCPDGLTVMRLGLPDGRVEDHEPALQRTLLALVPANSVLVSPYERDGHPDHEAVARVCLTVGAILRLPVVRYPIWAWHHGDAHALARADWGLYPLSHEVQELKRLAMAAYVSQLQPPSRTPIVPSNCLDYFRRAFEAFLL